MIATVPHVTSGSELRKFQADGFLFDRVYNLGRKAVVSVFKLKLLCLCCDEHRQCSQNNSLFFFCYFGSYGEKSDKRVLQFLKLTVQLYFCLTFLNDECARSRGRFIAIAGHFTTCRYQST